MICDEDSDCLYEHCSAQFRCSGENKLMDNDCLCFFNSECHSGRCEGVRPSVCEAKLGEGAYCSESSDCLSDQCTWSFHCAASQTTQSALADIAGSTTIWNNDETVVHGVAKLLHRARVVSLCFLLAAFGCVVYRWSNSRKQRRGYDQIPIETTVKRVPC
jgi:hypothetical protein